MARYPQSTCTQTCVYNPPKQPRDYRCHQCDSLIDENHTQYQGYRYCPNQETESKTEWLALKRGDKGAQHLTSSEEEEEQQPTVKRRAMPRKAVICSSSEDEDEQPAVKQRAMRKPVISYSSKEEEQPSHKPAISSTSEDGDGPEITSSEEEEEAEQPLAKRRKTPTPVKCKHCKTPFFFYLLGTFNFEAKSSALRLRH